MLILLLCLTVYSYDAIRIKMFTKHLQSDNRKMYIHFLKSATQYIEETYNVKRSKHPIILDQEFCHHISVPKKHKKQGIKNTDFVLYVSETFEDASWIAKSAPCAYDEIHRPIAGGILLNNKYFNNLKKKWQRYERFGTIVHELTHTLGFHREVMTRSNMTKMIDNKLYIKSNGIINFAREYFDCPTLDYLPLEDDGGKTAMYSHFEKMTFNLELMTGTASRDTINSIFTLLALQDTGLYRVNLEKAGRFEFGKGKGCNATKGTCNSPTVCTRNKKDRFCSYNYQHISLCKQHQKLAECGLPTAIRDCNKKKCFNIGVNKAKCLKSKCTPEGILVKYKNSQTYCQFDEQVIVLNNLQITCPIYRDFWVSTKMESVIVSSDSGERDVRKQFDQYMSVRKINRDPGPQTEGYKGVFKGVSENLNVGVGKYAPPIGLEQREHHFNIGWNKWQQSNETLYEVDYKPNNEVVKRQNCANLHPPTIHIDHINVPYKKEAHFSSEYKNYKAYENPQKAKPIRDKLTLMATQIVMGDDRVSYKTAQQIAQEPKEPQRQLVYHQKPEKYDIISNNDIDKTKKASAFDYWNPTSSKKHQSFNTSEVPQYRMGSRDPITGRFIS